MNSYLYVSYALADTELMNDPDEHIFQLNDPLVAGQVIEVRQTVAGVASPVATTTVKARTEDYPGGMPEPRITPIPIYKCAKAIGVRHLPGAKITVRKTEASGGTTLFTATSGADFTRIDLTSSGAFDVGDKFEAKQSLCSGPSLDESPYTDEIEADPAPLMLDPVTFRKPVVGQRFITLDSIVQGSRVRFMENPSMVITDRPSVPFHHVYDIDLLNTPLGSIVASDQLSAQQQLCGVWSDAQTPPSIDSCTMQGAMIPEIVRPLHGDDFVLVVDTVPGSTLRVFAWNGELGNGVGGTIALSRALIGGEVVIVTQSLPTCTVNQGFSIVVAPP